MKRFTMKLNSRDRALLYFLWRWKLATTATIARAIYPTIALGAVYSRLIALAHAGFIAESLHLPPRCHLWRLGRLGFNRVVRELPPLRQEVYCSENPGHDLIASAIHLGDFIYGCPPGAGFFTEQELRCLEPEFYPDWVPKSQEHRPDGYWNVPISGVSATIALEVELSRKHTANYEALANFYANEPQVIRVLWLTKTRAMGQFVYAHILTGLRGRPCYHDFVTWSAYASLGWAAPIELGPEKGKTVANLLGNKSLTSREHVSAKLLLDVRKSPHRTRNCRIFDLDAFRY